MGKSNAAVKNWISVKERFADFYNGTVFDGRQVVSKLYPLSRTF